MSGYPLEVANFGRNQLAELIHELDFKGAVEVGVADGTYSEVLMQANPQMELYGVDPFVPYRGYTDYTRKNTFAGMEQHAHDTLDKYPNYEFIKEFSMDAVKRFADDSLDFVYLDANHADPYITQDITGWWPKLRRGGIMAGHDWVRTNGSMGQNVKDATVKFAKDNNLILFILGTKAIREGEVRDVSRSWMIIK